VIGSGVLFVRVTCSIDVAFVTSYLIVCSVVLLFVDFVCILATPNPMRDLQIQ